MISSRILKGAESFQSQAISNWFSYSAAVTPRRARPCPSQVLQKALVAFLTLSCRREWSDALNPLRRCKQVQDLAFTSALNQVMVCS